MTTSEQTSGGSFLGRTLERSAVADFAADFRGTLVQPGDPDYDRARAVFNAMIDRRPALIARCSGPADVVAAVKFARSQELLVAVRAGGHSVPGYGVCDGGLVIDVAPMKGVWVDPEARTAGFSPASCGASSTGRRSSSGWPPPAGGGRRPV
jgi:hypothetical protein